jgi:DNA-binding CsgD family transcriptional regulator
LCSARTDDASLELDRARESFRLRAWADAYRAFSSAEQAGPLDVEDLELLATSAYLTGQDTAYAQTLERAHIAHLKAGNCQRSVRCAFWLGFRAAFRGDTAQATGWFGRAQRLLEREAGESAEHGYLLVWGVEQRLDSGDHEGAYATAERATEIGERFGDVDLVAMARHQQGRARLMQRRLEEGLALLDETMVLVIAGRLSPVVTGLMYCSVVASCQRVYALERACEWTAALDAWCNQQPSLVAFRGICRVHRAEVLELRGAWSEAISEARRVREIGDEAAIAAAWYRLGELHRLRGEFAEADEAYRSANLLGLEAQPGLALLRLAQGRTEAAAAAIRRAVKVTTDPWLRASLLPACVEILLAEGDTEQARGSTAELEALASHFDTGALRGIVAEARGAVELAEGDAENALRSLRSAAAVWRDVNAPHRLAAVRVLMGLACRALGDAEGGNLELEAARAVFERMGALPDLRRVVALLRPTASAGVHGLTVRELEVLRLVASGMTNKSIAGRLFVSERTVDRHVSNVFRKLGVSSRAAATASAYEHKLI